MYIYIYIYVYIHIYIYIYIYIFYVYKCIFICGTHAFTLSLLINFLWLQTSINFCGYRHPPKILAASQEEYAIFFCSNIACQFFCTDRGHDVMCDGSVLQYIAVCCSILQCIAVYCSVFQCVPWPSCHHVMHVFAEKKHRARKIMPLTATHCNSLRHTATRCKPLHRTATHCNTLRHTT